MSNSAIIQRTNTYHWNSKNSLYSYFCKYYNIDPDEVNSAIKESLKTFKQRQGQPKRIAELWEKVGLTLEKNNDALIENPEETSDFGTIASCFCQVSPFTLKPGRFFDIGIVSIPLAMQYGMNLFVSHRFSNHL
jgi:hypothetical protein